MERTENRTCMIKFRSGNDSASERVLDALKTIELQVWKANVKRVTVVKFRVNERGRQKITSYAY